MGRRNQRGHHGSHRTGQTLAAPRALGIDIGRVLIEPADSAADTSFISGTDHDAMQTPQSPGAFETIAALVEAFEGRVWLVSKCGPRIQARSRRWLAYHHFFERTGMPHHQLRFCRKRRDKAPICAELGLEAFIDDRPDVLAPMEGVVPWRYLFGPQKPGRPPAAVIPVLDWSEVAEHLLPLAGEQARVTAEGRPGVALSVG
ncbi:MAG: hypothetical protein K0V04_03800 [Deltaproteobacteria bacterium]|nr:hypothetical protein [Deltaproteobacteria bacterium]